MANNDEIKLYGFPKTRATRISWLLEELEQNYEYILVDLSKLAHRSDEYLTVNPAAKVPSLVFNGQTILESGAIVSFLADRFPEKALAPQPGTLERGRYEQWMYFSACELEQGLWTMGKHKFALPKEYRVEAILPVAEWEFSRHLALLSEGLGENSYILGDNFSAVDIMIGHTLFWALGFKQKIEQQNLRDYIDRIKARPALAKAWAKEAASTSN